MPKPIVLLTGASGFTGRLFARELAARGVEVRAFHGNLIDREVVFSEVARIEPDWVIHLAAASFVADTNHLAFYHVNVIGTLNLLEALGALKKAPSAILIASSANIYGTPAVEVIDETIRPQPINHYACSKLAMEHLITPWFERLPIVVTRPFNYTGLGQDTRFLIPKIVSHFVSRAPVIELGNLEVSRDFSDVKDVVAAYLALLNASCWGRIVNVCSGRAVSLRNILAHMADVAGFSMEVRVNPALMRANEIPVLRGDNRLLHELTGFTPGISIEETLVSMYQGGLV